MLVATSNPLPSLLLLLRFVGFHPSMGFSFTQRRIQIKVSSVSSLLKGAKVRKYAARRVSQSEPAERLLHHLVDVAIKGDSLSD